MSESSTEGNRRSWWQTLPGMLTAAAALISAITGLVVAVRQLRSDDDHSAQAPVAATATPANTSGGRASNESDVVASASTYAVTFPRGAAARLGELRYQVVRARATGGNPGQVELALRIRIANDSPYDANFWSRTFRLRVGTETGAPTNFLDEVVAGGTTKLGDVDFSVGAAARRATLLVGDEPSKAVALPLRLTPRS